MSTKSRKGKKSTQHSRKVIKQLKTNKHSSAAKSGQSRIFKKEKKRKDSAEVSHRPITGWRIWLFRIVALTVIPALLFLLLEIILRITGYGYPTNMTIKCKVRSKVSYCSNVKFSWRFFPSSIARATDPFVFAADKSNNTYRIFVMGASAAAGTPDGSFSLGRNLQVMLSQQYPKVNFEVITAAMPAINSHVVLEIAKDCARHQPDLFIVYLGNNEVVGPYGAGTVFSPISTNLSFIRIQIALKATRLGQLITNLLQSAGVGNVPAVWRGMQMFIEKQVRADDPHLEAVYKHFQRNLEDISRIANKNRTNIIFCTVGCNLKDSPPFTSLHRPDITEAEQKKWDDIYERGIEYESSGNYADAVKQYLEAAEIDGCYADMRFRMGRCYWEMGQYDEAKTRYIQARELDTLRFRADGRINKIIRNVAGGKTNDGVYLADVVKILEENSPHGIPGEELFYEHVHMNFKGNYLLAEAIFRQIAEILPERVKKYKAGKQPFPTETECERYLAYTDWDRHRIAEEVLNKYIKRPPFTNQLYQNNRVSRMEQNFKVLKVNLSTDNIDEIENEYRWAIRQRPTDVRLSWKYSLLLESVGKFSAAADQLHLVLDYMPHHYEAYAKLGFISGKQGYLNAAISNNLKAVQIYPSYAEAYYNLALAHHLQKKFGKAVEYYSKSILFMPDQAQAYVNLGLVQYKQGKINEAFETYRNGLKVMPENLNLHFNLGQLLKDQGRRDESLEELRKALQIDPNSIKVQKAIRAIQQRPD
jgi:tetratricopeptide (TPR) repeat protein